MPKHLGESTGYLPRWDEVAANLILRVKNPTHCRVRAAAVLLLLSLFVVIIPPPKFNLADERTKRRQSSGSQLETVELEPEPKSNALLHLSTLRYTPDKGS